MEVVAVRQKQNSVILRGILKNTAEDNTKVLLIVPAYKVVQLPAAAIMPKERVLLASAKRKRQLEIMNIAVAIQLPVIFVTTHMLHQPQIRQTPHPHQQ